MTIGNRELYVRGFSVQSGMDQSENNGKGDLHRFVRSRSYDPYSISDPFSISFLTTDNISGTFSWNDKRTLAQIEQMTGFTVKPTGVRSQFKHGGFVVYEEESFNIELVESSIEEINEKLKRIN